ncbi:TadE/TadG family type IV pilus assembly protein [Nocardioides ochotonae]|uniref:TadE/TadG family type IV pilus assembly protein n=1 Tax=Nocardioides ochotonae TaxID=2685869 RepID=UPI00140E39AF|nr:TadE/TadG family type IV pilus assembly protein [Nocardioides ochotonae]
MSTSPTGRQTRRRERGSVSLEVVGLVPLLILVALLVLQLGVAGWSASQAQEAARAAARAQSLGEDPLAAAVGSLPGSLEVKEISTSGDSVTLRVTVPRVSPLPTFTVTRDVAMAVDR